MPSVILIGHSFTYPISDVLHLFYSATPIVGESCITVGDPSVRIYSQLSDAGISTWTDGGLRYTEMSFPGNLPPNREVKRQLYAILNVLTGREYPWGSLTGIRPTQVARECLTEENLISQYFVSPQKAHLAVEATKGEDRVFSRLSADDLFLYIGIPFCPSRCAYCSFISEDAGNRSDLLSAYADAVLTEIRAFREISCIKPRAIYVGGGTPTVFPDDLFVRFYEDLFREFHKDREIEITVEAGRPDTITPRKLRLLKDLGVRRICLNPQTLSDVTLKNLSRKHTADDFYRAYACAKEIGFEVINTDLIAGLPGEDIGTFEHTLETILQLAPQNITVHALSLKRKAKYAAEIPDSFGASAEAMIEFSHRRLKESGYLPYYLYRQKSTAEGQENTGYAKPGTECEYNVAMMGDRHNILSFGAGSMSKRIFANGRLERCQTVRNPEEYIARAAEMARRKAEFFADDPVGNREERIKE